MSTILPLRAICSPRGRRLQSTLALCVAGLATAAVVPDPSFGVNGFATWSAESVSVNVHSTVQGVSLQADGTAFICVQGGTTNDVWLAQVGPTGALVTSVLPTGKIRMPGGMVANKVLQVVRTGSRLYVLALNAEVMVWRLLPDGTQDPSYSPLLLWELMGNGGNVSLRSDGSVAALLSGSTLHITADGVRDTTWGPSGQRTFTHPAGNSYHLMSRCLDDGSWLSGSGSPLTIIKPDGSFDTTLYTAATATWQQLSGGNTLMDAVRSSDGIYVLVDGPAGVRLGRLTLAGAIDATYQVTLVPGASTIAVLSNGVLATGPGAVQRVLPGGGLDTSFGNAGVLQVDASLHGPSTNPCSVRPGGQVVQWGSTTRPDGTTRGLMNQWTATGAPDTSFTFAIDAIAGTGGTLNPVEVLQPYPCPNGSVVAIGSASVTGNRISHRALRFGANGVLDGGFGINGGLSTPFAGSGFSSFLALSNSGGFAGLSTSLFYGVSDPLTCYDANGQQRWQWTLPAPVEGAAYSLGNAWPERLTDDGRLVLGGSWSTSGFSSQAWGQLRLTASGALDTTFGSNGSLYFPPPGPGSMQTLRQLDDGRWICLYSTSATSNGITTSTYSLVRMTLAGAVDATYGTNGAVALSSSTSYQYPVPQLDGTGAGPVICPGTTPATLTVRRLTAAGTWDATFGTGGTTTLALPGATTISGSYPGTPSGQMTLVCVSGSGSNNSALGGRLCRLTSAGLLDPGYGAGGYRDLDAGDTPLPLPDGSLLAYPMGMATTPGVSFTNSCTLHRYTAAGVKDPAFGANGDLVVPNLAAITGVAPGPGNALFVTGITSAPDAVIAKYLLGGGPGDLNGDGVVNVSDLSLVTAHFGQSTSDAAWDQRADANGDGVVNVADLTRVTSSFGQSY
jgi:uncharacterized delta-60 repeat protein